MKKTKFMAKFCLIKKVNELSLIEELVFSSWQHCSFIITIDKRIFPHIEFPEGFQEKPRSMACDENLKKSKK